MMHVVERHPQAPSATFRDGDTMIQIQMRPSEMLPHEHFADIYLSRVQGLGRSDLLWMSVNMDRFYAELERIRPCPEKIAGHPWLRALGFTVGAIVTMALVLWVWVLVLTQ